MIICHVHISNRNAKRERASTSRKLDSVLVAHAQTRDRTLKLRSRRDASNAQRIRVTRSEFVVVVVGRLLFELELQRANVARWQHDEDGGGKVARAAPQVEQHQRQRA